MRIRVLQAPWLLVLGMMLGACAAAPKAAPATSGSSGQAPNEHGAATTAPAPPPEAEPMGTLDAPERSRPPSTASYEQAMAVPEPLDINDERAHLDDAQLVGPMRNVMSSCPAPTTAKVTAKVAVQGGRAIGVTVLVRFEQPRSGKKQPKPRTRLALKLEAKSAERIGSCVDRAVRALVWAPNSRRDSFTTQL